MFLADTQQAPRCLVGHAMDIMKSLTLTITQYPSLVIRVPSVWKRYDGIDRYNSPL